jgi:hypothetical protein
MGQDCPSMQTASQCRQSCDNVVPRLSEDCRTKAVAYYVCGQGDAWVCEQNQVFPHAADAMCNEQSNAYGPCLLVR